MESFILIALGKRHSTFFQVGCAAQIFVHCSVGLANWFLPLKEGSCELKISKFGGMKAKIWVKIEAVEAKISKFFWKGGLVNWLLSSARTAGEAWKGGLQGRTSPHPFLGQCPPNHPWPFDNASWPQYSYHVITLSAPFICQRPLLSAYVYLRADYFQILGHTHSYF